MEMSPISSNDLPTCLALSRKENAVWPLGSVKVFVACIPNTNPLPGLAHSQVSINMKNIYIFLKSSESDVPERPISRA